MARSAAELKALVASANQIAAESQAMFRSAIAKAQDARAAYSAISEKLAPAVFKMNQAEQSGEEATVQVGLAISEAEAYSAPL
jgi:hypothetical protein